MKRLLLVSLPLFVFALTGCNTDSTELPVDGRDFDGVRYSEPGVYSGVVMDGYLRNARVWLDIDGDGQYTSEPVTVTLPSGKEVIIESGEPTTMSEASGAFSLDTSELVRDPLEAPNLDPRNYPLMALAIPGTTIEETAGGDIPISQAYLLAAPAGVRNVTPLTSLLFSRQLGGVPAQPGGSSVLVDAFRNINLKGDYIKAGSVQAQVYAAAMARFLASQFPAEYSAQLQGSDGTQRAMSLKSSNLLWISFAHTAVDIIQAVEDKVPDGRYENVNVADIDLPVVNLDLSNPYILRSLAVYAAPQAGEGLPAHPTNLTRSAELTFDYDIRGRVRAISANGCMSPSMQEIARLANTGGYIADTDIQWLPGISLSEASSTYFAEKGVDERLEFDWDNKTAVFDTATICEYGLASGSELGAPARAYSWEALNGKVEQITGRSATKNTILSLPPGHTSTAYRAYTKTVDGTQQEKVTLPAVRQSCEADIAEEDRNASRVVSARQGVTFEGLEPQPTAFINLMLEFDDRGEGVDRLLSYSFLDPALSSVESTTGFTWEFYYPAADAIQTPEQPNLIREAVLLPYRAAGDCGRNVSVQSAAHQFARITYSYTRLSEYLADGLE